MPELFQDDLPQSLIPTKVASDISGYNADYLARLCREKKILGTQLGRSWLINRASLENFVKQQGQRNRERADKLRATRGEEYRKTKNLVFSSVRPIVTPARKLNKTIGDRIQALSGRTFAAANRVSHPTYSPRLAALAVSLAVVAGSAYASTEPRALSLMAAVPEAAVRLALAAGPGLTTSSSFLVTAPDPSRAELASHIAETFPRVPESHHAARAFSMLASNSGMSALAAVEALMDDARTPLAQTPTGALAAERIARIDEIAHNPTGSLITLYVGAGEIAFNASTGVMDAYLSSVQHAGDSALAAAATTRDGVASAPRLSASVLSAYTNGIYAWNDAAPKAADTAVLALATLGDAISTSVGGAPSAAEHTQRKLASSGVSAVLAFEDSAASAGASTLALALQPAAAAPQNGVFAAVTSTAPQPAAVAFAGAKRPLMAAASLIAAGGNAVVALPVKAEDAILGAAGYASSLLDGTESSAFALAPSPSAPSALAMSTTSSLSASAASAAYTPSAPSIPANSGTIQGWFARFFHNAGVLAQSIITSGFRVLAGLFPSGNIATPALTVLHTGPTNTLSLPILTSTVTRSQVAYTGASAPAPAPGSRTVIENFITKYYPSAIAGNAFDDAVLAAVRPFLQRSIDAAITSSSRGNGGSTGNTGSAGASGVNSNGATLTNVTISSGSANLSNIVATNGTIGTFAAGSTTLGTTTVNGDLNVGGTLTVGTLAAANLSSMSGIIAPYITATDTNATSSFTNLTATNAALGTTSVSSLSLGGANFTSLLGAGLMNSNGSLAISTSSFSGAGSNFNADLLDGYDSSYFLARAFSTTSVDYWFTNQTTDALTEGLSNLYYTNVRARNAISSTGAGISYASSTGVISVTSGYSIPLTASTSDWNLAYLNRITAANAPLSINNNILSISQANGSTDGYLSSASWNAFNNKVSSSSLSALYPLSYTSSTGVFSLAFGTSSSNTWGGTQTFINAPVLGSLTGFLKASAGVLSTSLIDLSTDVSSTLPVSHGGTGSTSLTGLLKGNGTGPILMAVDGADYLSPATIGSSFYAYFHATTTDALSEGTSNLYFTTARARSALSSTATGLSYNTSTGSFTLTAGYVIPLVASTTEWSSFYDAPATRITAGTNLSWAGNTLNGVSDSYLRNLVSAASPLSYNSSTGVFSFSTTSMSGSGSNFNADLLDGLDSTYFLANAFSTTSTNNWLTTKTTDALAEGISNLYFTNSRARSALSFSGTGLTYATSTGTLSVTAGYSVPLTASTTDWNLAYLNRITAASAPLTISNNTLSIGQANALSDGYLSSADWNTFNGKVSSTSLSATGPLAYDSSTGVFSLGTVGQAQGGTGFAAYNPGDILYADNSGTITKLPVGTTGQVLKIAAGLPSWGQDQTVGSGGAGDGVFATSTNLIYPIDTSSTVVIGSNSTSTLNSIFEVAGQAYVSSKLGIGTTSPSTQLSVTGNGLFSGTFTAGNFINTGATANTLLYANASKQTSAASVSSPLSFTGGTLSMTQANGTTNGYLNSTDWTTFNGKLGSTSLSALYPLTYNSSTGIFNLAFGTSTSNTWGGTQTFTNAPVLGALTGIIHSSSGTLSAGNVLLGSEVSGTLGVSNGGTGSTTLTGLLKGNGTGGVQTAIPGTDYQAAGNYLTALTGDIAAAGPGSAVATLATVNGTIGSFGSTTAIPNFTVNAKGLITAAGTSAVIAPAGTLTGTTLASGVTASSLTSLGTLTALNVSGSSVFTGATTTSLFSTNFLSNTFAAGQTGTTSIAANGALTTPSATIGSLAGLIYGNAGVLTAAAVSSPLSFTGGTLSISQANGSTNGYLNSTDWTTFNGKLGSTSLSAGSGISYNSSTGVIGNAGVLSFNGRAGVVAPASGDYTTSQVTEGSNLYYTDTRARAALSFSGTGLTYTSGTGVLSVTSGYTVPLTASTTDWNTAYLNRITAANAPLSISNNVLSISQAGVSTDGYLSSIDWNTFTSKQAALSFAYPLVNTSNTISLAFGTTTSNLWGGTQTFTNAPVLGALTGILRASSGVLSTSAIALGSADVTGTLGVANGGTGSTTLSGLLKGNGTGGVLTAAAGTDYAPATTGTSLLYGNNAGGFSSASVSSPLTFSGGVLGIQVANTSQPGYLTSLDWNTFNGKENVLSFTYPLTRTTNTIALAFGTTTANSWSGLQTFNGGITTAGTVTLGSLSGVLRASSGVVSTGAVALGSEVLGTLPVANGGTGSTTLSGLLKGNGTGGVLTAVAGTDYQAAGNYITALTGDVTASGPGSAVATLATVNSNTGSFGSSTAIPTFTVNGKGLITAAGSAAVIAPAGTLTGTTLASGVTASSLTSLGTLTALNVSGNTTLASATTTSLFATNFLSGTFAAGQTGTTTISSTGALTTPLLTIGSLSGLLKASSGVVSAAVSGTDYAPATSGAALLYGNNAGGFSSASVSSPLTFSGGVLGIQVANNTQPGYLTNTDWSTFNGKQAALTFTYPLLNTANTISLAFGTTTLNTWSQLQTFTAGFATNASSTVVGAFNVAGQAYFGGNVGIGTTSPYTLLGIQGTKPVITINDTGTSGIPFQLRNGVVTAGTFDIYDAKSAISLLTINQENGGSHTGMVIVGSSTNNVAGNNSRLFVFGGANGANIDTMGDKTLSGGIGDQTNIEAEGADWGVAANLNSIAIRYFGNSFPNGLLNIAGVTTHNTGVLDFGTADNSIILTRNATPIIFGVNGSEVARLSATGFGIGTTSPYAKLSVVGQAVAEYLTATSTTATSTLPNLLSTNLRLSGRLYDSANSAGTNGNILQTTGAGTQWVATSSLGLLSGSGASTQVAYWGSGNALTGSSVFTYNGTDLVLSGTGASIRAPQFVATDSVGSPGFTWVGSLGTGIYSPAANTIGFTVSGAEKARLSSSGFFGIGTTSPWGQLSINTTGVSAPAIAVGTPSSVKFLVTNAGNVGIGTTTPFASLSVNGTVAANDILPNGSYTNGISNYSLGNSGAEWNSVYASNFLLGPTQFGGTKIWDFATDANDSFNLYNSGGLGAFVTLAILQSGKTGIGTTTPFSMLSVSTTTASAPTTSLFAIASSTNATLFNVLGGGNVGIGTSTPGSLLSISGIANFTAATSTLYSTGGMNLTGGGCYAINGTCVGGASTVGSSLLYGNGSGGFSNASLSSPLTFSGGVLGIQVANNTQPGYLTSADWSTFNGKQAALTGTTGQFPYFSGTDTVTATSSLFLAASSNVGIGTTTPWAQLSVNPNGILGPAFAIGSSTGTSFIVNSAGNVGIGTSTPGALLALAANAASVGGLSSELTDATGWTSTDWTGSYGAGFTHTSGNTSALSRAVTLIPGDTYQVSWTASPTSLRTCTVTLADAAVGSCRTSGSKFVTPTTTGSLVFTPTSLYASTISNISVKHVLKSSSLFTLYDTTGASSLEFRSPTASLLNTLIGLSAGQSVTGSGNTALGALALTGTVSGSGNSGFGTQALYANISGSMNSAFGYQALASSTSSNNSAFGYQALLANTGFSNTALGQWAMGAGIPNNGTGNVAIGTQALYAGMGSSNVAIGNNALGNSLSTGPSGSIAIGEQSQYSNVSGYSNVAIGVNSLTNNVTGTENVAIGQQSLHFNQAATSSIAIGSYAGRGTNFYYSQGAAILGYQAGYNVTTGSDYNTLLGYQAGYGLTTGANNIVIGANPSGNSTNSVTTGSNNILLGYDINLPSTTGSNQLNIGNLLYATGLGTGSTLSSGNIGVGTTTPWAQLSLNPNGITGPAFAIGSSTATKFLVTNTGKVGINTLTPNRLLQIGDPTWNSVQDEFSVAGTNYGYFSLNATAANGNVGFAFNQGNSDGTTGNGESYFGVVGTNTDGLYGLSTAVTGLTSGSMVLQSFYSSAFHQIFSVPVGTNTINFGGNVGIGTSTPGSLLSINGIANFTTATSTFYSTGGLNLTGGGCFAINGTCVGGSAFSNTLANGGTATTTFYAGGVLYSDGTKLTQSAAAANFFWDETNKRLGIGTTTPDTQLEVSGSVSGTTLSNTLNAATTLAVTNRSSSINTFSALAFRTLSSTLISTSTAEIVGIKTSTTANIHSGALAFLTLNAGSLTEKARITKEGRFGLGTSAPSALLQISGTAPADVTGSTGTNSDSPLVISGAAGGNSTSNAATVFGGSASNITVTAGAGGSPTGTPTTGFGGGGGSISLTAGAAGFGGGTTDNSGAAGSISITGGLGAGSIAGTPSNGGDVTLAGGGISGSSGIANGGSVYLYGGAGTATGVSGNTYLGITSGSTIRGKIGVGTTTPWAYFSINPTATVTGTGPEFVIGSSSAAHLIVNNAGSVGIGTTSPTAQFSTTGTVRFSNFGAGTLQTDASGNLTVSSDERLKNMNGFFSRGLADLQKLDPILYHWNALSGLDQSTQYAGFSAQNVKGAIPEAVTTDNRGFLALQDRPILATAVNAIKELAGATAQLSISTSTLGTQIETLSTAFAAREASSNIPQALTATNVTAQSIQIAQAVSAGSVNAESVTAAGTVSAARYVVPQEASVFTFGSTTVSVLVPAEALTVGGNVDLYKLASYGLASIQALSSRTDLLALKIDDLASRVAALEAMHIATTDTSTTSGAIGFTIATLQDALKSIGIIVKDGMLALDTLVSHQLVLVRGADGTSSTGSEVIPAGATTITVSNPLVHTSSKIFLTFTASVDGSWYLSKKQEGSFTITLAKPQPADTEFDYFLIQTDPNAKAVAAAAQASDGAPSGSTEAPTAPAPVSEAGGPTVILNGDAAVQLPAGAAWTDPGAKADAADGTDLTSSITVSGSVDLNTAGLYTLTYSVTDGAGKHGQASRVVAVLSPASAPASGATVTAAPADTSASPAPAPADSGAAASASASTDSGSATVSATTDASPAS